MRLAPSSPRPSLVGLLPPARCTSPAARGRRQAQAAVEQMMVDRLAVAPVAELAGEERLVARAAGAFVVDRCVVLRVAIDDLHGVELAGGDPDGQVPSERRERRPPGRRRRARLRRKGARGRRASTGRRRAAGRAPMASRPPPRRSSSVAQGPNRAGTPRSPRRPRQRACFELAAAAVVVDQRGDRREVDGARLHHQRHILQRHLHVEIAGPPAFVAHVDAARQRHLRAVLGVALDREVAGRVGNSGPASTRNVYAPRRRSSVTSPSK